MISKQNITMILSWAMIWILFAMLLITILEYASPESKEARLIKSYDKISNAIVESIDLDAELKHIEMLQRQHKINNECYLSNLARHGTLAEPKTCDEFWSQKDIIEPEVQIKTNIVQAKEIHNLPGCTVLQWEQNHIKQWDPTKPYGWWGEVYATDIRCNWEAFKVYASWHKESYTVYYNWFLKGWTGNTVILQYEDNFYLYGHTQSNLTKGTKVAWGEFIWATDLSWVTWSNHLHFEIWQWKNNLSSKWEVNPKSEWLYDKRWNIQKQSITDYLNAHNKSELEPYVQQASSQYNMKQEMLVCVMKAETGVWAKLKTAHNYGNIGNTDSGKTRGYATAQEGVDAIARMITEGTYLKWNKTVRDLSTTGPTTDTKQYASDPRWSSNILECLSKLHWENITLDYIYKT